MVEIRSQPGGPSVLVSELLALLPESYIADLSEKMVVDKWAKKLKASTLFQLVLFSILNSERLSLRVMQENMKDPMFAILGQAVCADEVTWVSIRNRLMHINSDFFRGLYEKVYQMAEKTYGEKALGSHHLKRFDSTMVHTFAHLLEGMKVGNLSKGKTQVKFTTELKDDFLIYMSFHKDQAHLSEETALKESVLARSNPEEQEISVFDKGMKSRKTFAQFDNEGTLFVARVHETPRYELISTHSEEIKSTQLPQGDLEFIQDSVVNLYESSHKVNPAKLRLIQFTVTKDGKILSFVTNVWDIEPQAIAQIYKMRWDIEVLFRFMKQEMNLSHFVSNDQNAIEAMLYCTMIASMLVLIYKKKNNIASYKLAKIQFFNELINDILLEYLESPESSQHLKQLLLNVKEKRKRVT